MKKGNSTLNKRLRQYSAMAGSMLAVVGVAKGQVMYTDVNPDSVFTAVNPFPGDNYGLDLNNDGIIDFNFVAFKYSSYVGFALIMNPATTSNLNAIQGTVTPYNNHFYGYVSDLGAGSVIDSNAGFFKMSDLVTSLGHYFDPLLLSSSNGNIAGNWQPGETDRYIGLKFSPDGINTYFGWVRLDVAEDASSITIKDYAYNATPNHGLPAGSLFALDVASVNQQSNFNIFGYDGVANIFVNDGKLDGATVTVTNMIGEIITKQSLTNRTTRIDLNEFAKGIYLVTVQRGDEILSKKISFR